MKEDYTRKSTIYIKNIPTDLKNFFKAYCAKRNKSMKDAIIAYMRRCIESK